MSYIFPWSYNLASTTMDSMEVKSGAINIHKSTPPIPILNYSSSISTSDLHESTDNVIFDLLQEDILSASVNLRRTPKDQIFDILHAYELTCKW